MSPLSPQPTPGERQRAWSRVRMLTRGAVLAATGLTALIGVVVAKEHAGSGTVATGSNGTGSGTGGATTTTTPSSSSSGDDSSGSTSSGSSSSSSNSPSISYSQPTVTSGGTSR